jgi:hypothetical protein
MVLASAKRLAMLYLYGIYPQNKQPTVGVKLGELHADEGM